MSLDGFISGPGETGFEHLFAWFGSGDVEVPTADPNMTLRMTKTGADHYGRLMDETGAIVVGRKLFDFTQGWGGQHPLGCPVVVLTHNPPADWPHQQFHFVSTGIEGAVKKAVELADGKIVGVNGGEIASQCLAAGLLEEVWIDLVPVLLGGGTPLFPNVPGAPALLDLVSVLEDEGVTHLRYRVRRDG
jgi:dihydrofolate reductase